MSINILHPLTIFIRSGPYTVFAPSNTAFNNAPPWQKEAMKNSSYLVKLLNYHILQDELVLDDIANEMLKPTLAGIPVRFNVYDKMVSFKNVKFNDRENLKKKYSLGSEVMSP